MVQRFLGAEFRRQLSNSGAAAQCLATWFQCRTQALEIWIGAQLIDRSSQPSQLTEVGKLFLPVAQKIVDFAEAGKAEVQTKVLEETEKMRFQRLARFPRFPCLHG